jgi:sulfopropanediol 3-dehydrogenase
MAFGIEGIASVNMIVGAGNKYVAEAKRQLFGTVGIDLIAGPTEILIIADEFADPVVLAADLLGQAEHDPNARQCLISLFRKTAQDTIKEVERQLVNFPTGEVASVAWRNTWKSRRRTGNTIWTTARTTAPPS